MLNNIPQDSNSNRQVRTLTNSEAIPYTEIRSNLQNEYDMNEAMSKQADMFYGSVEESS